MPRHRRAVGEARLAAGLKAAGISIDGLRDLHDELRGVAGSFDSALASLARLRAHGVKTSVNTQIGEAVVDQLDAVLDVVIASGAKNWQLQLTVPMGRAADRPALILQPYRLKELFPKLATLFERASRNGVLLQIGNNLGYFGPYEGMLRGNGLSSIPLRRFALRATGRSASRQTARSKAARRCRRSRIRAVTSATSISRRSDSIRPSSRSRENGARRPPVSAARAITRRSVAAAARGWRIVSWASRATTRSAITAYSNSNARAYANRSVTSPLRRAPLSITDCSPSTSRRSTVRLRSSTRATGPRATSEREARCRSATAARATSLPAPRCARCGTVVAAARQSYASALARARSAAGGLIEALTAVDSRGDVR